MTISQVFLEALESLNANKLRSGLTILGIVIGVAAVIAMLAIGQGAQDSITNSINGIGTNVIFISSGARSFRQYGNVKNVKPLTNQDVSALLDPIAAPDVIAVSSVLQGNATVSAQGASTSTEVIGVEPNYAQIRNTTVAEGNFITDAESTGHRSVALIGPDLGDTLFGTHTNLIGQSIRIGTQPFTIIGILQAQGGTSSQADSQVLIPITTARDRVIHYPANDVQTIYVQAASAEATNNAINEVTAILESRGHVANGVDDFSVFSQQSLLQTASSVTGVMTTFLGGIAGISLLVGGIGIMNIMLVSVAERTREIGLRKSLGARKRDILVQFLAESLLLSLLGGLIGILLGWLISGVVGQFASSSGNALTPVVSIGAILLATLFSAAIGLFFGIYPANRAASLQPVEALRYE